MRQHFQFNMLAAVHPESCSSDVLPVCLGNGNSHSLVELVLSYVEFESETGVKYVNAFRYYMLSACVHDLDVVQPGIRVTQDVISVIVRGRDALKKFSENEDPHQFRSSLLAADGLMKILQRLITEIASRSEQSQPVHLATFSQDVTAEMRGAVAHFESMLGKELADLPLFCVAEQGNLSTRRLIKGASQGYAAAALTHLSDFQRNEIDASGRCLAFREPTASGFHITRAIESLIKQFAVKATNAPPKKRDWGHYVEILEANGADPKVTLIMKQINNLYRKPLMHPEDVLTPEEGIGLFCISQSAIEGLVADMLAKGFLP